jgi:hypothetical protein
MLRIGFLPSDFNPMVLLLGDAEDFRALGGVLRQFARAPAAVRVDRLAFCVAGGSALTLTAARATHAPTGAGTHVPTCAGTHVPTDAATRLGVEAAPDGIVWRLDADQALGFAAQLDVLADPGLIAGSEMLECSTEEEIPVKASRGEYTEDFLLHA